LDFLQNEIFVKKVYDINWSELSLIDQNLLGIALMKANQKVAMNYVLDVLNFESFISENGKVSKS
jgi:hypothetical protein